MKAIPPTPAYLAPDFRTMHLRAIHRQHLVVPFSRSFPLAVLTFVFAFCSLSPVRSDEPTEGEKLFALRVKPILSDKCIACHGDDPEDIGGNLDLRTRESLALGGDSFGDQALIPGNGSASQLYRVTAHLEDGYEMPPKLADRLSEQESWWIRDWIDQDAPWPNEQRVAELQVQYASGEVVATSKALSDDWQNRRYDSEKLWAYRPLSRMKIPEGEHPVDWFINKKLEEVDLQPAADASALAQVRRMSFGLTGLPPSIKDVEAFKTAYAEDPSAAVSQYADQLMASPHYGEHFGQHWLDVTRYSDTAGYANDYARPNAWRYRDYVVRAFNSDKPFNQFIREQIAGDEIDASDTENLIATGFLRMGPWELTGMSVFKEMRQLWLDDVTDSVGQTFLGHALQCAKCHDHKFDPVPTRDYYSIMAVFSTTQFAERKADFLQVESQANFAAADEWAKKKIEYYSEDLKEIDAKIAAQKKVEQGDAKVGDNGLDPGDEASQARMRKNKSRHEIELDRTQPWVHSVYTGKTIRKSNIRGRIELPEDPWKKGFFEPNVIFTGGSVYSEGAPVQPGALSAAESLGQMKAEAFPAGTGTRRLALANWIARDDNPLTARVIVNRVWSWHFGQGIAANPNNLGGTGGLPTHPALLDYLADWFVQNGWSIKKLNQLIVSSVAYRRSSQHPEPVKAAELDPKSQFYATFNPRRLTAEELRDAMLFASGELNTAVGGLPSRPDMNSEVAVQPRQIMGGTASVYEPDPLPSQRNRRSLYTEKTRGLRDPFFETFNQPGMDDSCELRETSTVAPQALTLLNAEEIYDRALAFANRLMIEANTRAKNLDSSTNLDSATQSDSTTQSGDSPSLDVSQQIVSRAFRLTLGRRPSKTELALCVEAWRRATEEESGLDPKPKTNPTSLQRTVMAEKTGEPYTFTERLPTFESYVHDLQRSDVDAETRGLAHICLVLFNANEFAYVD